MHWCLPQGQKVSERDEFKNADPDLVTRIDEVTQEPDAIALELAHHAGVQTRKKRRDDDPNRSVEVREHASMILLASSNYYLGWRWFGYMLLFVLCRCVA